MAACLVCGKICDKVDKKWMFIIGMIIAGAFNGGICYGMVSVSMVGIISDCFEDEEQRGTVMGWYNGAMALVGAVMSFCFGLIAASNWKMASQLNWVSMVAVVLGIIFIPACPPKSGASTGTEEKEKGDKGWAKRLIPLVIAFFLVSFAAMSVMTYIDLYVSGNSLGSASLTGLFGSVQTIASFVACTFFGVTYKKLGSRLSIPCYLLVAGSILLMFLVPSKPVLLIAAAVFGASWGTVYTYWFVRATVVVPENMVGTATGIITTANSLSYLPMAYFMTGMMGMMHTDNFRSLFPIYAGIIAVVFVGAVVLNGKNKE